MKNPNILTTRRILGAAGLAILAGLTMNACGNDDMETSERTVSVPIVCDGGSNVVVMGPFSPGVDQAEMRIVTTNQAVEPDMVPQTGTRQPDEDDFVFVAACETGAIKLPESVDPNEIDAVLSVTSKDQFGTVELKKTEGYLSKQDVEIFHGEGDSIAYIKFDDADDITDATVSRSEEEPVTLVG